MRAAEAIILGSTLLKSVPSTLNDGKGGGCALGMINAAHGEGSSYRGLRAWMDLYPWLNGRVAAHIADNFNNHVHGDHTMTLEQLADWVDSVDPTPREVPSATTERDNELIASVVS